MKKNLFKIVCLLVVASLCLCFVGCSKIDKSQAKENVKAFFGEISDGDYEGAKQYLHPDKPYDLKLLFENYEAKSGCDLSRGITVEKFVSTSSSAYESEVDGSEYSLEVRVRIGGFLTEIDVDIVKNDNGYGIYEIDFED